LQASTTKGRAMRCSIVCLSVKLCVAENHRKTGSTTDLMAA